MDDIHHNAGREKVNARRPGALPPGQKTEIRAVRLIKELMFSSAMWRQADKGYFRKDPS